MRSKINFQDDDDQDLDQTIKNGKLIKEEKMRKGKVLKLVKNENFVEILNQLW